MKFASYIILLFCANLNTCSNRHIIKNRIEVSFTIDDVKQRIKENLIINFIGDNDTFSCVIDKTDYIKIPDLISETYTIILIFNKDTLEFRDVKKTILKNSNNRWAFGIDNKPFNNLLGLLSYEETIVDTATKKIQYWQFYPTKGDGIQFVNKLR
ncbi:MAG: hypothetical protein J0M10_11090 [Chitinophagales bacterium]|nr:hypothetical protein [Chitinophagales bacterium]